MLGTMPSRSGNTFDAKAVTRIYADDLADLPSDDVRDVIRRFRRGDIGDRRWAPTVGEIRQEVNAILDRREKFRKQDKALREQIAEREEREARREAQSVDERKAVVETLLVPTLRAGGKRSDWVGTQAEAQDRLEAWQGGQPQRPVSAFSEKLMAQFRGELPIGSGHLGPVALTPPREAAE